MSYSLFKKQHFSNTGNFGSSSSELSVWSCPSVSQSRSSLGM